MEIKYTEEQMEQIRQNLKLLAMDTNELLKYIANNPETSHNVLPKNTGISKHIVDKCIVAFLACGLVNRKEYGPKKLYSITEQGKKLLKLEGVEM